MIDYFSYLQSVVVEQGHQLPLASCDYVMAFTKDDSFPLSHLYRLYRENQVCD